MFRLEYIPADILWARFIKEFKESVASDLFPRAHICDISTHLFLFISPGVEDAPAIISKWDATTIQVTVSESSPVLERMYLDKICQAIRRLIRSYGSARHRDLTTRG